jgi:hypothetical protein
MPGFSTHLAVHSRYRVLNRYVSLHVTWKDRVKFGVCLFMLPVLYSSSDVFHALSSTCCEESCCCLMRTHETEQYYSRCTDSQQNQRNLQSGCVVHTHTHTCIHPCSTPHYTTMSTCSTATSTAMNVAVVHRPQEMVWLGKKDTVNDPPRDLCMGLHDGQRRRCVTIIFA